MQYYVRGRRKREPLKTRCQTVQDIIDLGQQSFHEFTARNPWICIDSKRATVFVGLDPERPITGEAVSKSQGGYLGEESIQI